MPRTSAAADGGQPPEKLQEKLPERLLEVATALFAERGFDRTSVQDIVDAAGVTKGALYHYFGAKEDLLFAIYAAVLRMQTDRLESFAAAGGPVLERLRAATVDVIVTTIENLPAATVFYQSLRQLSDAKQRTVRGERRRYHETFRALVEEGQREAVLLGAVSADLAVDFLFGAVHHLPRWYSPDGPLSPREVGESYADLFLRGLGARL